MQDCTSEAEQQCTMKTTTLTKTVQKPLNSFPYCLSNKEREQILASHLLIPCTFGGCFPLDAPRSVSELSRCARRMLESSNINEPVILIEENKSTSKIDSRRTSSSYKESSTTTSLSHHDEVQDSSMSGHIEPTHHSHESANISPNEATECEAVKASRFEYRPKDSGLGCESDLKDASEANCVTHSSGHGEINCFNEQRVIQCTDILALPRLLYGNVYILDNNAKTVFSTIPLNQIIFVTKAHCEEPIFCISLDTSWINSQKVSSDQDHVDDTISHIASHQQPPSGSDTIPVKVAGYALIVQCVTESDLQLCLDLIDQRFCDLKALCGKRLLQTGSPEVHFARLPSIYRIGIGIGLAEADTRGGYFFCPHTKGAFKTRAERDRRIWLSFRHLSLQPVPPVVGITRVGFSCISPWLDLQEDGIIWLQECERDTTECNTLAIAVHWPREHSSMAMQDSITSATIHIDACILGVTSPFRLTLEIVVRTIKASDRIWLAGKREAIRREYDMSLAATPGDIIDFIRVSDLREQEPSAKASYLERLNKVMKTLTDTAQPSIAQEDTNTEVRTDADGEEDDDVSSHASNERPIVLSGQGHVDRNITDAALRVWSDALARWDTLTVGKRAALARRGVPEAMRKDVWARLSNGHDEALEEQYRFLLTQPSGCENVIAWDLERTFPAHPYFRDSGQQGQIQLGHVCHAYAVFDEEISYVQGLSFIVAVLLLHLPEETAFVVFVKMMKDFGLRDLYKEGFENLSLRFNQLERLMEEYIPDVHAHFANLKLDVHMFASQWFLTLYSTKFPLNAVFRIFDLFFAYGFTAIFQVAIALLKMTKKDILQLDFENVLSFFRHDLPALFVNDQEVDNLINIASKVKVTQHWLAKHEKEYLEIKAQEAEAQDPIQYLKSENERLKKTNMDLEVEMTNISQRLLNSQEMVESKTITLHELEESKKSLESHLEHIKEEAKSEAVRLQEEIASVKELYRTTLNDADESQLNLLKELKKIEETRNQENTNNERRIQELEQQVRRLDAVAAVSKANEDLVSLQCRVHDLEVELAETKLKLVETECRAHSLEQLLTSANSQTEDRKRSSFAWLSRTKRSSP